MIALNTMSALRAPMLSTNVKPRNLTKRISAPVAAVVRRSFLAPYTRPICIECGWHGATDAHCGGIPEPGSSL